MYCPKCGEQNDDSVRFCTACGTDVTAFTKGGSPASAAGEDHDEIAVVREALSSDYEVVDELGRGGMAVVFRAIEKELEREVALKVLPFSLAFDKEFVERFQREARTAARLEHPNIIPIYRVGRNGSVIYFAMKFLRGKSLADLVEEHGPMETSEIERLLRETASALGYAHKNEIVHRDIKPDNILLDENGRGVITDFGIAKAASGTRLTGTGMAIGTPHYMSPEQARAQPLDGRSDIYSLGVVAYQCLTGRVPFDGTDAFSIGYKHITEDVPEPELRPDQQRIFQVIKRMMAKSPDERFQSAAELVEALSGGEIWSGESLSTKATTPIRPSQAHRLVEATSGVTDFDTTTPTTPIPRSDTAALAQQAADARGDGAKSSKKGPALAAALLVVLLGGGGGGYAWYANANGLPPFGGSGDTNSSAGEQSAPAGANSAPELSVVDSSSPAAAIPDTSPGVVVFVDLPDSAVVTIGDQNVQTSSVSLAPGTYSMLARRTGYEDYSYDSVVVEPGDTTRVPVNMPRVQAAAQPESEPAVQEPPRPQAQCHTPGAARFNLNNGCFDQPPSLLSDAIVTIPSSLGIPSDSIPTSVIMVVTIDAQGQVVGSPAAKGVVNVDVELEIIDHIFEADFSAATKNGRAVQAVWDFEFFPVSE